MKRYLFIIALLLGAVCSWGQSAFDQAAVLKKILTLPELQNYFPKNADGSLKQLYISQYPTKFSAEVLEAMEETNVEFLTHEAIKANNTVAYIVFRGFVLDAGTVNANVNYFYGYDHTTGQFKMLTADLELKKSGTVWNVSTCNLGGDK